VQNVDVLFFMLGWDWFGFHKKRVGTRYTELVFVHPVGHVTPNSPGRRDLVEHDNPATRALVLQAIEELAKTSRTSTELRDEYEVY
jgi:hypothetical protein